MLGSSRLEEIAANVTGPAGIRSMSTNLVNTPKGGGGRSSVSGLVATVFGATGFLGRYVVQQLAKVGTQVFIPYRGTDMDYMHLKPMGDLGQIVPREFSLRDESSIREAIGQSNIVINLIGRDHETRNFSFEDVYVTAPATIARLVKEHGGIERLVHVTCLGASKSSPSRRHQAMAAGEEAVHAEYDKATILRPGAMFGTEDRLLNKWAIMSKKFSVVTIVDGGKTRLQPVHVVDVAGAVMAAIRDDGQSLGKIYELGGPDVTTVRDLVELMFETIRENPQILSIPMPLAELVTAPRELLLRRLPIPLPSPTFWTREYLETLKQDQIVSGDALTFSDLGLTPRKLEGVAIEHLYAYRAGGPSFGKTVGERVSGAGW
ncbi:hypothetical protein CBR_g12802 [Chara braunii]|uniref:NAD-dependent epimerase/dehydratase domain-containing protein n=1 Tax=Chara braunii TaxID=69332 RepID=A0A388KSR5_CHABU|nr:hypothetical protein CBR_g12802 [Chara braunii]|eukprot:GBG73086.1 hypothetical protein CBR_g12802 [Chara braunii]